MDGEIGYIFRDRPSEMVLYQLTPGVWESDACSGLATLRSAGWEMLVQLLSLDPPQA